MQSRKRQRSKYPLAHAKLVINSIEGPSQSSKEYKIMTSKHQPRVKTANSSVNGKARKNRPKPSDSAKFHSWKVGTINILTGNADDRLERCIQQVQNAGLTVCGLQEVRRIGAGNARVQTTGDAYDVYWSGYVRKREAGVGIAIKVQACTQVLDVTYDGPRHMTCTVNHRGCLVKFVIIYAPTEPSKESTKQAFYRKLETLSKKPSKKTQLVVMGDFNARTTAGKTRCNFGPGSSMEHHEANTNGEKMVDYIRAHNLSLMNSWFTHKDTHRHTFVSNSKYDKPTTIDYIHVSKWLRLRVTDCRVRNSYTFESDHRLLVLNLKTPSTKGGRFLNRTQKSKKNLDPIKKLDLGFLKLPTISEKFCAKIKSPPTTNPNIDTECDELIESLRVAALESLPKKTSGDTIPRWRDDPKLAALLEERDTLCRTHGRKHHSFRRVTKDVRVRVKTLRDEYYKLEAESINKFHVIRDIEKLFRKAKSQESTLKPIPNSQANSCPPELLTQHFKAHFNPEPSTLPKPPEIDNPPPSFIDLRSIYEDLDSEIPTEAPDEDEVRRICEKLKNKKASCDIPPELLKHGVKNKAFLSRLTEIFRKIWETGEVPEKFGVGALNCLWKRKGSRKDPSKYRALSIGSALCKVFVSIILSRLDPWYNRVLAEEQQGFRRDRGTQDAIYTLKRLSQISGRLAKPLFCAFIDLTAAFDTIDRPWMFDIIRSRFPPNTTTKNIDLLQNLYSKTSLYLNTDPTKSTFPTTRGVRQGGGESPPLFCVYMDHVMRLFTDELKSAGIHGVRLQYRITNTATDRQQRKDFPQAGETEHVWLGFADDIALTCETESDLRTAMEILHRIFTRYKLQLNRDKTMTMIINFRDGEENYVDSIISLDDKELDNAKLFKYLGSHFRFDELNTGDTEITLRIESAKCTFAAMKRLFTNYAVKLKTRMVFFDCYIRTRLTYSCQTWSLTARQIQKLRSTHCQLLRKLVSGGHRLKYPNPPNPDDPNYELLHSNDAIMKLCNTTDIMSFINSQRTKFMAHLIRGPNSRHAKQLTFNSNKTCTQGNHLGTVLQQTIDELQITLDEFCKKARKRCY